MNPLFHETLIPSLMMHYRLKYYMNWKLFNNLDLILF